jgi:tetratricopeptide (TPR) repeat protein
MRARERLSARRLAELDVALEEYRQTQMFNADRAEGSFNWGAALAALGRTDEAERAFRTAIGIGAAFSPAYVNLADLLRRQGRENDAQTVLRTGLEAAPDDALLHHALGLSLVRSGRLDESVEALRRAAALAPDVPRYAYTLGVALRATSEPARGLEILRAAHERFPGHADTLTALATMSRDEGSLDAAATYAQTLVTATLGDPGAVRLLREIEARQ